MHYFFLEKLSPYSQRWKLREVAFDPKTRYLYYSVSLRHKDVEEALAQGGRFSGHGPAKTVTWKGKIKVTALTYMADEYATPPTAEDFDEKVLLTLLVTGLERRLDGGARSRGLGLFSFLRKSSSGQSTPLVGPAQNTTTGSGTLGTPGSAKAGSGVWSTAGAVPELELPSTELHVEDYHVRQQALEDMEDEDENMFRDIELAPDDDEDEEDESDSGSEGEDDEEGEEEEEEIIHTPLSSCAASTAPSTRSSIMLGSRKGNAGRQVTFTFRAPNYEAYRVVSLRLRQALVRHHLCAPLHHGLPPYDPRNGIAFATVPLYLRHAFRRLNDVVFYSFQCGHAVYVRNLREVRGIHGYLCITHDSILLIQGDGKNPRWLDLEDITAVDYAINKTNSFVSILAVEPYPDLLFIPIFPPYPLCSTFDPEEAVEGIVSMLRRLLMQRLRAGEEVSLAPPRKLSINPNDAEDVEEYDALCHIRDVSADHADVFHYITYQGAGRPLQWRWDNSKRPRLFTYKKDLAAALKRGESDSDDEDEDNNNCINNNGGGGPERQHSAAGPAGGRGTRQPPPPMLRPHHSGAEGIIPKAKHVDAQPQLAQSTNSSVASFTATTVAQLLAPPSKDAELRAKRRLRVSRSNSEKRQLRDGSAASAGNSSSAVTASGEASTRTATTTMASTPAGGGARPNHLGLPPRPKLSSYGLVSAQRQDSAAAAAATPSAGGVVLAPEVVPASKGTKVPATASACANAAQHYDVSSDTTSSSSSSSSTSSGDDDAFDSEDMDDLLETPREASTAQHSPLQAHRARRERRGRGHVTVSDEEEEESSEDDNVSMPSPTLQAALKPEWFTSTSS